MTDVERLTIDLTVARDYLAADDEQRRERHERAVELFKLARRGDVELVVAPQGYRLDVEGDLAEQLRGMFSDEGVALARQLAYASEVTFPGDDLIVGAFVPGFADAWNQEGRTGKSLGTGRWATSAPATGECGQASLPRRYLPSGGSARRRIIFPLSRRGSARRRAGDRSGEATPVGGRGQGLGHRHRNASAGAPVARLSRALGFAGVLDASSVALTGDMGVLQ